MERAAVHRRPGRAVAKIADAIAGGCELLEVRCRRCSHESLIDLTEVVWPREKPVHTLAKVLRCQACKDERKRPQPAEHCARLTVWAQAIRESGASAGS